MCYFSVQQSALRSKVANICYMYFGVKSMCPRGATCLLVTRGYPTPPPFVYLSIQIFIFNNISLIFFFHLFYRYLTRSCLYAHNLMATAAYMCRPSILLLLYKWGWWQGRGFLWSTCGLLFHYKIPTPIVGLSQNRYQHLIKIYQKM